MSSGMLHVLIRQVPLLMKPPSQDPNCQKYIDDPDRVWNAGQWRTLAGLERRRASERQSHRERYASDPQLRARSKERERKRRVRIRIGGVRFSASVDNKEQVLKAVEAFKQRQKEELRGLNKTVS